MKIPSVVIVGRPNVGKSTLFNALVGRRIAITDAKAGTTRDRILHTVEEHDAQGRLRRFDLVDTGGLGIVDAQSLEAQVEHQIDVGIESADLLVFLLNAQEGATPHDEQIANRLRRTGVPVLAVCNKCDNNRLEQAATEFWALGMGEITPVSAAHRRGLDELRERIAGALPEQPPMAPEEDDAIKLAVVGRRNVGKSTFVNALAEDERVIASDTPGTTRDSVDVRIDRGGKSVVIIDTAGVRRRTSIESTIEFFAIARAERAIRRADVVVVMLDAAAEISQIDKQIAERAVERGRPVILAVNKWDLARAERVVTDEFAEYIADRLPSLHFAPLVFTRAETGENVWETVALAHELREQARRRHATAEINRVFRDAIRAHAPHAKRGRLPKAYYAVQTDIEPPTFVLFVNDTRLFAQDYLRYLQGRLRQGLDIEEIPVRIRLKSRGEKVRRRRRGRPGSAETDGGEPDDTDEPTADLMPEGVLDHPLDEE